MVDEDSSSQTMTTTTTKTRQPCKKKCGAVGYIVQYVLQKTQWRFCLSVSTTKFETNTVMSLV
jgi:hypothetical protein